MAEQFFVGIYCPPYPPKESTNTPDRCTKEIYNVLSYVGINSVFGHFEDHIGGMEYVEKALTYCDELNMSYYPRLWIFKKFIEIYEDFGDYQGIPFLKRSKEEQEQIKKEMIDELRPLSKHPSFKGIMLGDEAPVTAYPGIGEAYNSFKKEFPDKEFHYNTINYLLSDHFMFATPVGQNVLTGDLEDLEENHYRRFHYYMDKFVELTGIKNYYSSDHYPYLNYWEKQTPNVIHFGIMENAALMAEHKMQNPGTFILNYIQLGQWAGVRSNNEAEISLNINICLAYDTDGYVFFPGITPNDFIGDERMEPYLHGKMGFIDDVGNKTVYVEMVKPIIAQTQLFAPILLNSKFMGVFTNGEYQSHLDPNFDTSTLDCPNMAYLGQLPEICLYKGNRPNIETKNQVLVSVYQKDDGSLAYFLVNTSICASVEGTLSDNSPKYLINDEGKHEAKTTVSIKLKPGHACLIF